MQENCEKVRNCIPLLTNPALNEQEKKGILSTYSVTNKTIRIKELQEVILEIIGVVKNPKSGINCNPMDALNALYYIYDKLGYAESFYRYLASLAGRTSAEVTSIPQVFDVEIVKNDLLAFAEADLQHFIHGDAEYGLLLRRKKYSDIAIIFEKLAFQEHLLRYIEEMFAPFIESMEEATFSQPLLAFSSEASSNIECSSEHLKRYVEIREVETGRSVYLASVEPAAFCFSFFQALLALKDAFGRHTPLQGSYSSQAMRNKDSKPMDSSTYIEFANFYETVKKVLATDQLALDKVKQLLQLLLMFVSNENITMQQCNALITVFSDTPILKDYFLHKSFNEKSAFIKDIESTVAATVTAMSGAITASSATTTTSTTSSSVEDKRNSIGSSPNGFFVSPKEKEEEWEQEYTMIESPDMNVAKKALEAYVLTICPEGTDPEKLRFPKKIKYSAAIKLIHNLQVYIDKQGEYKKLSLNESWAAKEGTLYTTLVQNNLDFLCSLKNGKKLAFTEEKTSTPGV